MLIALVILKKFVGPMMELERRLPLLERVTGFGWALFVKQAKGVKTGVKVDKESVRDSAEQWNDEPVKYGGQLNFFIWFVLGSASF